MNILFISPNSPRESIGGVERYISNLIKYSRTYITNKIVIVLPTYKQNYTETLGNLIIYFDCNMGLPKDISSGEISEKAVKFSRNIEEIIKEQKIDIICAENFHVGLPPAFSLLLNMVAAVHKTPLVLRLHSFATTELQTEIVNRLLWKKISCVSKSVTGDCFQKGADIALLSTDYLGVDTTEFNNRKPDSSDIREKIGIGPKEKVILTASRILHGRKSILAEKGIINLIQAFSKLSPRYSNLRLLIAIGKPPENLTSEFEMSRNMLAGYIKLNNVEDKVTVSTFGLEQMAKVYHASDIFALPSANETFGQVFIESMSCGLPVIGTNTGGIPEIISDTYNGFLVPANDSSALAHTLEKLINDQFLRERLKKGGTKTVRDKFTYDIQFKLFINMLQQTL